MLRQTILRLMAVSVTSAAALVFAYGVPAHAASREDFNGTWSIEKPVFAVKTLNGQVPPLTASARKTYDQDAALRAKGDRSYDPATWCAGIGIPRLMFIDSPFQILVQPRNVMFLYQWDRWARLVDMSGVKLEVLDPASMGVAMGAWQGDTLVITTIGLRADTLLDSAGLPHTEDVKITERLRLLSPDKLEDVVRIEDGADYSRPWETRLTYRRLHDTQIHEDVCLDRIRRGEPAIKGE